MHVSRTTDNHTPNLPPTPSLRQTLGPSFILLGLALGSGEIIMWPYLVANWGLGIIWGAVLGISIQFLLNTEIMRYTLYWGESVFVGLRKLNRALPLWFILSTFIPWGLPGFSSAAGQIFGSLFSLTDYKYLSVVLLVLAGFFLSGGKTLYQTMEKWQRAVVFVSVPFFVFLTLYIAKATDYLALGQGLVGVGNGWQWLPKGIPLASFLGALVYSGAGGNLNFAQSYYIKEKGFGMGKYAAKITSLFTPGEKTVPLEGRTFAHTQENAALWKKWWKRTNIEHALIFWFLGLISILFLSLLSYALIHNQASPAGLDFIFQEGMVVAAKTIPVVRILFLSIVGLALYSTQIIVLESSSRIISENYFLFSKKAGEKVNSSLGFYVALWAEITLGIVIILAGFKEPRFLLTLAAVLNAVAMTVAFPLVYILNKKTLGANYQPGLARVVLLTLGFLFFVFFTLFTLRQIF